jgi:signal transduction histidine kinase
MSRPTSIPNLEQISGSLRWMWLAALALAFGLGGAPAGAAVPLAAWTAWSAASSLLGWRQNNSRPWRWGLMAADVLLGLLVVTGSGGAASPLWSALLLPGVEIALRKGGRAGLTASAVAVVATMATTSFTQSATSIWVLASGIQAVAALICAAALAWSVDQVRQRAGPAAAPAVKGANGTEAAVDQEAGGVRSVLQMAAELNSTLNYERVLDLALDFSAAALSNNGEVDEGLVSVLLLFQDEDLVVASGRRLTTADLRTVLPGKSGILARALEAGRAERMVDPGRDLELQRLVALHACGAALCLPLSAGLETYGVLLFAHPDRGFFRQDRVNLLEAIAQQAMVALQNARLYRDLEQEKERITEIQEEARKKLARDLHDGPTQSIAAIAMRVNFARRLMERDAKSASAELFKVEDLARRTTKEIRHMLFTLRPLILESQGLVAALQQLGEKVRETHGQNVEVEADPRVAEDLELGKQGVIFYIAEEAINNARKHAEAEHIVVRLRKEEDLFFLEVEDDGVGFNVGAVDSNYEQRGSLGMVNMRERAELVNGALRIDSREGQGTRITVIVPMSVESAERLHRAGFPV